MSVLLYTSNRTLILLGIFESYADRLSAVQVIGIQ